jgi:hypothetical protein
MIVGRRGFFFAVPLALFVAGSAQAAPRHSWDGTWSGAWGGSNPTSITIAGKRVVSYVYQGMTTPVVRSHVTPTKVVYGDNGVTVTLIRTGKTTASASLHSQQGDATAQLTKQ